MRISRFAAIAVAAIALGAVPAGTALASTSPAQHRPVQQAEQFSVQRSAIGNVNVNDVEATGPVTIAGGTDTPLSLTRDVFAKGAVRVLVTRNGTPRVSVDRAACTVTVTQHGQWFLAGLPGADHAARGSGTYELAALFAFAKVPLYKHGPLVCPAAAVAYGNVTALKPKFAPLFGDVAVHGTGTASL